ncbi:MAG: hypothetical protein H8D23_30850 [Candidatus Brocadiales bacterium]|nr:hypothetical protein [Candidatus Brocadiales bacterium]
MDKKQKENFEKIKDDFKFEDPNDNFWLVKFPIYDQNSNQFVENYSYKKGNYYDIKNVNEAAIEQNTKQVLLKGRHKLVDNVFRSPRYYMQTENGQYAKLDLDSNYEVKDQGFKRARYPFFRPTDQCSVSRQEAGGVCFQEACRQHDLCFQTLAKPSGSNLDEHFNKCNANFEENIGKLCAVNKTGGTIGWMRNMSCQSWKHLFYTGVQWGDAVIEQHKGYSFNKSQIDQSRYLNTLYNEINDQNCLNDDVSKNCIKMRQLIDKLRLFRGRYKLNQREAKDVSRK